MKFADRVFQQTKYTDTFFLRDDNKIGFNLEVLIDDFQFGPQYSVHLTGVFEYGPFEKPRIWWSSYPSLQQNINNCKPCFLSYMAGGQYQNNVGRWLDSTYVKRTPENLLYAFDLAKRYQVGYLVNQQQWDELFYLRSHFTDDGNWYSIQEISNNIDVVMDNLRSEIQFFGHLKTTMLQEKHQYFKLPQQLFTKILPTQLFFVLNSEVIILLQLLQFFEAKDNFDFNLVNLIIKQLPKNDPKFQIWSTEILHWNLNQRSLKQHFIEFNQIRSQLN